MLLCIKKCKLSNTTQNYSKQEPFAVLPKKIKADTENYLVFTNFLLTILLVIYSTLSTRRPKKTPFLSVKHNFFLNTFFGQSLRNGL